LANLIDQITVTTTKKGFGNFRISKAFFISEYFSMLAILHMPIVGFSHLGKRQREELFTSARIPCDIFNE
jgi:hypothetical protein